MKIQEKGWPYTLNDILECEFYVLEALDYYLIIYHPYRSLQEYIADIKLEREIAEVAWCLVNDSYCTDLCLMFPPFIIALSCIYLAAFLNELDLRSWFSELNIDMKEIWMVSTELLEFYELWKKEKTDSMTQLLSKLPTFSKNTSHPLFNSASQPIHIQ